MDSLHAQFMRSVRDSAAAAAAAATAVQKKLSKPKLSIIVDSYSSA
jgi:hypothetical protein